MASLSTVQAGDPINSSNLNQIIDVLSGNANVPVSLTGTNDAALWALDVRNQDPTNQRSFRVRNASGETLLSVDDDVTLNQVSISSGTITGSTITNSRLSNPSVATASPGVLAARLDSTTLGSTAASVTLTVGSTAYRHLELHVQCRQDVATAETIVLRCQLNGDTGGNYTGRLMFTSSGSTTPSISGERGSTVMNLGDMPGSSVAAGVFGQYTVTFNNYASTLAHKTLRSEWQMIGAAASSNALTFGQHAYSWNSTAQIATILLAPASGAFSSGSVFSLYGLP